MGGKRDETAEERSKRKEKEKREGLSKKKEKKRDETPEERAARKAAKSSDGKSKDCLLYTSPSPRDLSTSRMPSSA